MRTKNIFATLLLILTGLQTVCGQKIRLYTTDNKTFEYSIAQLDSIVFVDEQQVIEDIVVTIDANGNADDEHLFIKIDESNFYIDDIKYTANQGLLSVTGYNASFFRGEAKIINTLVYQGRKLKVTSIGTEAFKGCKVLTSVVIPNSVTSIGQSAFYGCNGLTSITIPGSVTSIGSSAFYGCSGLTSITIPNSVTSIRSSAFYGCSGLTSITIPNSVTSIGSSAFYGCSGLTSITIPNSVTSIGQSAFGGCSSLTSVHITDLAAWCKITFNQSYSNPLEYAKHLYLNGKEIKDLVIPEDVKSIGNYAFSGCSGLTSVTIPNSVTRIGDYAFYGCSGLTSITIPNSVTSIGEWAFYNCSGLTSITIGSGVTSIGNCVFQNCSKLETVTIPNSVTSIGSSAFYGCSGLKDVYCYATNPASADDSFSSTPISSATLHVPAGSVNAYKATSPWSDFGSIVAI